MKNFIQITFIIAEYCSLACTYCYEKHKNESLMSFETAKTITDRQAQTLAPTGHMQIEFFGGEPFLNFRLLRPGRAENVYAYESYLFSARRILQYGRTLIEETVF